MLWISSLTQVYIGKQKFKMKGNETNVYQEKTKIPAYEVTGIIFVA